MMRTRITLTALGLAVVCGACGGEGASEDETARDLSLAPAESIVALDDRPQETPQPVSRPQAARPRPPAPKPEPEAPSLSPPVLPAGTVLELAAVDTISSRVNQPGETVTATATTHVTDPDGNVLIPAGAVFTGVIEAIEGASGPGGQGTLVLAFNRVTFGGRTYDMEARSDTVGAAMRARGVSAGDAAKVGVGAAAGAIAGRILGRDTKGAIVGGVVGAAAGAGIAVATKDRDIVLPAGGLIRLVLAAPMVLEVGGE